MAKNSPPVSNGGQLYNVTDDETVVVQASQFFTDPDGDPLTFRLAAPVDVDYGKVFDNPDGTITVALNARNPYGSRSHGFLGYDVLVTDGTATVAGTIGFFVDDVYDPIVARDFTVRTTPGQPVTFNPAIYANYLDRSYTATAITDVALDPSAPGLVSTAGRNVTFEPGAEFNTLRVGQTGTATIAFGIASTQSGEDLVSYSFSATTHATATVVVDGNNQAPTEEAFHPHALVAQDLSLGAPYILYADRLNDAIDGDDLVHARPSSKFAGFDIHGGRGDDLIRGGDLGGDINGGAGNDIIYGGALARQVKGGAGNDTVYLSAPGIAQGGDGRDFLVGSEGSDVLKGGAGDDVLVGGTGTNQLTGGAGDDRFVFNRTDVDPFAPAFSTILDFTSGHDKIDLRGFDASLVVSASATVPGLLTLDPTGTGAGTESLRVFTTAGPLTAGDFVLPADATLHLAG